MRANRAIPKGYLPEGRLSRGVKPRNRYCIPRLTRSVKHWSLTTLREKLIKIGAKVVTDARYVIFQMAEVAVPKRLFRAILARIRRLRLLETVPG